MDYKRSKKQETLERSFTPNQGLFTMTYFFPSKYGYVMFSYVYIIAIPSVTHLWCMLFPPPPHFPGD